jgi:hypothetical protein
LTLINPKVIKNEFYDKAGTKETTTEWFTPIPEGDTMKFEYMNMGTQEVIKYRVNNIGSGRITDIPTPPSEADKELLSKVFPDGKWTTSFYDARIMPFVSGNQQIPYNFTLEDNKVKLVISSGGMYKGGQIQSINVEIEYDYKIEGDTLTLINPKVIKNEFYDKAGTKETTTEWFTPIPEGDTMKFEYINTGKQEVISFRAAGIGSALFL